LSLDDFKCADEEGQGRTWRELLDDHNSENHGCGHRGKRALRWYRQAAPECVQASRDAEPLCCGDGSFTIDIEKNPELQFRIDNFSVPAAARAEFEAAMQRNLAFIQPLPGEDNATLFTRSETQCTQCLWHLVSTLWTNTCASPCCGLCYRVLV
jgi:hypothetical protein